MLTKPQISERTNSMTHINHWNSVEKSTELKHLKNSFRGEAVSTDHFVRPSVCRSTYFEFFLPFLKRQCPSPYNVILYVWMFHELLFSDSLMNQLIPGPCQGLGFVDFESNQVHQFRPFIPNSTTRNPNTFWFALFTLWRMCRKVRMKPQAQLRGGQQLRTARGASRN